MLRWLDCVAWPADFGFDAAPPTHQHLLRATDVLDEHSQALAQRTAALMRPKTVPSFFYDLTTVELVDQVVMANDVRLKGRRAELSRIVFSPAQSDYPRPLSFNLFVG